MLSPDQIPTIRHRRWLRTGSFAKEWGRSRRTITRWCVNGTLLEAGCAIYYDSNEYWIGVPR